MNNRYERKGEYCLTNIILGEGSYGKAYICFKNGNKDEQFCMKIMKIPKNDQNLCCNKTLNKEKEMFNQLKDIDCENLVKLISLFQTDNELCEVMELCELDLNQLFQNYQLQKEWFSREKQVNMVRQILKGAQVLRENKIVHRDIKPQNILVKIENLGQKNERNIYKIADFGYSKRLVDIYQQQEMTLLGTKNYLAPEIANQNSFSGKCDIYSYGILIHQITFNRKFPGGFESSQFNPQKFHQNIKNKPYQCQCSTQIDPLGKILESLIQEMLIFDQNKRISFEDLLMYDLILLNDPLFKPLKQNNLFQNNIQDKNANFSNIYKILDILYRKSYLCQKTAQNLKNTNFFSNFNIINIYYLIQQIGFHEIKVAFAMINLIVSDFETKILKNCDLTHFLTILKQYLCSQDQKFLNLHQKIKYEFYNQKKNLQQIYINLMIQYQEQIGKQNENSLFSYQRLCEKQSINVLCKQLQNLIDVQETYKLIQEYNIKLLEEIKKISVIEIRFDFFEYQSYESDLIIQL